MYGCRHRFLDEAAVLDPAVNEQWSSGACHLIEARTDHAADVEMHDSLWAAIALTR